MSMPEQSGDSFDFCVLFRVYFTGKGAPLFLALAISNGEPQKELAKKAQGKSVVHIHNTDIQEVTIAYPSKTEQDRIVSVFRQLDNLITLHQRKCNFRKRAKK